MKLRCVYAKDRKTDAVRRGSPSLMLYACQATLRIEVVYSQYSDLQTRTNSSTGLWIVRAGW